MAFASSSSRTLLSATALRAVASRAADSCLTVLCLAGLSLAAIGCDIAPAADGAILGENGQVKTVLFGAMVSSYIVGSSPLDEPLPDGADPRVILVDTGIEEEGAPLLAALEEIGRTPEDVAAIFITHGHTDHIGTVSDFPDATLYAFYGDVALIQGEAVARRPLPSGEPEPTGLTVDETLTDGQVLSIAGIDVRAFSIPGHTAGSAAFLADGTLFLGDAATVTSQDELDGAIWVFSGDTDQNDRSLSGLEARLHYEQETVTHVACSHSGASPNGLGILSRFAKRVSERGFIASTRASARPADGDADMGEGTGL